MVKIKLYLCGGEHNRQVSQYPLGLGYLKSNWDAEVSIVDKPEELIDCDLIGLSTNAWGIGEAINIAKTSPIPVVVGGQGTLWDGLVDFPFKHIITGEGELALPDILDPTNTNKIIRKPQITNIDNLNFPDRGKVGNEIPILTARGCPFKCSFCSSKTFWEGVRFHSPEYFIEEVSYLLKTYPGRKTLYIFDDLFIANTSRFDKIYELWMSRGFNTKIGLRGFIRSNIFTKDTCMKMKNMGFRRVRFGAESGSDRMLKLLNKGATVAHHQRAIDIAKEVGLPISASFMHGLPDETEDDTLQTKTFIAKNKPYLTVEGNYQFKAFPGTELWDGESPLDIDMRVR